VTGFLARRQSDQELRVQHAIRDLQPDAATAARIARLATVGIAAIYPILARLEERGEITSEWADGPEPRRRVYRVAGRRP
jgi:predicted Rossmann fold nucleotide-binding protein DprA/Smf involved in DNA uptake